MARLLQSSDGAGAACGFLGAGVPGALSTGWGSGQRLLPSPAPEPCSVAGVASVPSAPGSGLFKFNALISRFKATSCDRTTRLNHGLKLLESVKITAVRSLVLKAGGARLSRRGQCLVGTGERVGQLGHRLSFCRCRENKLSIYPPCKKKTNLHKWRTGRLFPWLEAEGRESPIKFQVSAKPLRGTGLQGLAAAAFAGKQPKLRLPRCRPAPAGWLGSLAGAAPRRAVLLPSWGGSVLVCAAAQRSSLDRKAERWVRWGDVSLAL